MFFQFHSQLGKKIEYNWLKNIKKTLEKKEISLSENEKTIIELEIQKNIKEERKNGQFILKRVKNDVENIDLEIRQNKMELLEKKILESVIFQHIFSFHKDPILFNTWNEYISKNVDKDLKTLWSLMLDYFNFWKENYMFFFDQNKKILKMDLEFQIWQQFKKIHKENIAFQEWFFSLKYA